MEFCVKDIKNLKVHGRTIDSMEPLILFWTGSGFECNVSGSELWVDIEVQYSTYEPWFSYTINGDIIGRQMLVKGRYWVPLFRSMNPTIIKNIRFYRENQPVSGDDSLIKIHGFRTDGEFYPVEDKKKIEFIGDSLTSGEGLFGSNKETDWISMLFSAIRDYTYFTADMLGADYRCFSHSGWGIHHGWNNDLYAAVPRYYKTICGHIDARVAKKLGADKDYDFTKWQPDTVVINLGTNDCYSFEQPAWEDPATGKKFASRKNEDGTYNENDVQLIQSAAVDFLKVVRQCNPKANIVWCYGMLGYVFEDYICEAINEYKQATGDCKVSYLRLPETNEETLGAVGHPGVICHKQAATVLADYIVKNNLLD